MEPYERTWESGKVGNQWTAMVYTGMFVWFCPLCPFVICIVLLYSLQLRILQRAMKMLKDDGRIVYSTCSLNPVENEAVIAAALRSNTSQFPVSIFMPSPSGLHGTETLAFKDFELVDVSARFPELKRRPGLTTWRPTVDRSITTTYESFGAFLNAFPESETVNSKMTEGHWPPNDAEELGLPRWYFNVAKKKILWN